MDRNSTVIVTGGAGYVGAHACKALSQAGFTPVTFDDLRRGWREAVRWGPLVEGDILDADAVNAAFDAFQPAAVLHFAAYAYVGESTRDPATYYVNNVAGSATVFDAAARRALPIVFSSSCVVYGASTSALIAETEPLLPVNPYGVTKRAAEAALADVAAAHGVRYAALRYFNAAGADADGEIGERHAPETHLIPLAIEAALGGAPLTVFGDDYDTADGSAVRDYVHVTDLADAHVRALRHLLDGGGALTANLGTGVGRSVFEVIDAVHDAVGVRPSFAVGPRRPGDPAALAADPSLAQSVLGWRADRDLGRCVADAVAWRRDHGRRFFA